MSALIQHNGKNHANPLRVQQGLKFNEQVSSANPDWHWVTDSDRLKYYQDKQNLVDETKRKIFSEE